MFKNQVLIIIFSLGMAAILFLILLILSKPPETIEEQDIKTTQPSQSERISFPRRSSQNLNTGGVKMCNPNYTGCLEDGIGDFDCEGKGESGPNFTGRVQVLGADVFNLDNDQNGWACDE